MKNSIYILILLLVITACKQDIPFPATSVDSSRFSKIETFIIDTLTLDTLLKRTTIGTYDSKRNIKEIKFYENDIYSRTLTFSYPSSKSLVFQVSPRPTSYGSGTTSGRVVYDNEGFVDHYDRKYKNEYNSITGWLGRYFFFGNDKSLDSSEYSSIEFRYPEQGYLGITFNGNNINSYTYNPNHIFSSSIPSAGGYVKKTVNLTYNIIPNITYNNYNIINIEDNFLMEFVWDGWDFSNGAGGTEILHNEIMYTVQPFLPSFNWTGKVQDALVNEQIISGILHKMNTTFPYYKYSKYEYEGDSVGRVVKKIRRNGNNQIERVWNYYYE